jgi:hypothetical protein
MIVGAMKLLPSLLAGLGVVTTLLATESPEYSAHEWGTFTSVQGADGAQMRWNPLSVAELPKFVHSPTIAVAGKDSLWTKQRLETPVIYFHAPAPLTVNVDVAFPDGQMTEWFPSANSKICPAPTKKGFGLSWPNVAIIPRSSDAAAELESKLPTEKAGSHYYAARDAESDFIRVPREHGADEVEKYIFYRGIGKFDAPLKVTIPNPEKDDLRLENTGSEALRSLVVVRVGDGQMTITPAGDLQAKTSTVTGIGSPVPIEEGRGQLVGIMRYAVARAGLSASEAAAMVKTWDESWFTERGVRVLYVLPRAWADSVLPLTLTPAPTELERVFVGRAEVITPAMEIALAAEVEHARSGQPEAKAQAVKNIRALGLGRFLAPAFQRFYAQHTENIKLAAELCQAVNHPEPQISQR